MFNLIEPGWLHSDRQKMAHDGAERDEREDMKS
jgi:hypothetical protein